MATVGSMLMLLTATNTHYSLSGQEHSHDQQIPYQGPDRADQDHCLCKQTLLYGPDRVAKHGPDKADHGFLLHRGHADGLTTLYGFGGGQPQHHEELGHQPQHDQQGTGKVPLQTLNEHDDLLFMEFNNTFVDIMFRKVALTHLKLN